MNQLDGDDVVLEYKGKKCAVSLPKHKNLAFLWADSLFRFV